MIYVFFANGFEESEAIVPIDIMRRAGLEVTLISTTNDIMVTGSHGIVIKTDAKFNDVDFEDAELLVLPGGMPGTKNLDAHAGLCELLQTSAEKGIKLAAICAAPMVFGNLGLLNGEKATCYPGFEEHLIGAEYLEKNVVVSSNQFITSRGAGTAMDFGLKIVEILKNSKIAEELASAIIYR
ncbi:MAG: DJ-1/PfpI family protein [Paludibacteraceae bacterium]|nr:DJ-1/PfpI family protein [Paludibacteraceae bacterium]MEE3482806.1 DJ-1 family glyoxalase III [Bacteroidales bacterium]